MHGVRPKKFLGQHFLKDENIAQKIVNALSFIGPNEVVVEIGPGTGVLTKFLVHREYKKIILVEIDHESTAFLKERYALKNVSIVNEDFLQLNLPITTSHEDFSLIGNFPYNISSQIFFKVLEQRPFIKEVVCMVQREVAQRICASHGNKTYGILSVFVGAYYEAEMLFKVPAGVFHPPPKVESAVIKLRRKKNIGLDCDEDLFRKIVKQGFQNRRKTLRNALKQVFLPLDLTRDTIFDKRAEQLSVEDYIYLTQKIQHWKK